MLYFYSAQLFSYHHGATHAHTTGSVNGSRSVKGIGHCCGSGSDVESGVCRRHNHIHCVKHHDDAENSEVSDYSSHEEETSYKQCSEDASNCHRRIRRLLDAEQMLRFPLLDRSYVQHRSELLRHVRSGTVQQLCQPVNLYY